MVSTAEVREIDIRYKATGVNETIETLNRLIRAEEGVVVVSDKIERSDASVARGLNAVQGRYVEHHRLIQQTTRDMNLLHEARARELVDVNSYQAALAGIQAKLLSVADVSKKAVSDSASRAQSLRAEASAWAEMGRMGAAALLQIDSSRRVSAMGSGLSSSRVRRSDDIEAVRRSQEIETAQRLFSESYGIGRAAPSARSSASVFEEAAREAEEAAKRIQAASSYAAGGWSRLSDAGRGEFDRLSPATARFEANRDAEAKMRGLGGASKDAAGSFGLASHQLGNLTFQINDMATMAAMGAPPLQILASQAGQVFQIFQQAPGGPMKALQAFFSNPVVLWSGAFLAAGAAALYFFRSTEDGVNKADRAVDLHRRNIEGIKSSYGVAADGLREMVNQSDRLRRAEAARGLEFVQNQVRASTGEALKTMGSVGRYRGVGEIFEVSRQYSAFAEPIMKLREQLKAGVPDIEGFQARVMELRNSFQANDPRRGIADSILEATKAASEFERRVPGAKAAIDALNYSALGGADAMSAYATGMGKIIDMVPRLKAASDISARFVEIQNAYNTARAGLERARGTGELNGADYEAERRQLDRARDEAQAAARGAQSSTLSPADAARRDHELQIQAIRARTTAERVALAGAQKERELAGQSMSDPERKLAIERAKTEELERAKRELADADRDRTVALRDQFAAAQASLTMQGASIAQIEAERFKREQLADVERQALVNGAEWAAGQRAEIERLAPAWGRLAEQAAQVRIAQDLAFQAKQIDRTKTEQDVYAQMNSAGLLANGEIVGSTNLAIAAQIRHLQAVRETSDAYREAGETIAEAMGRGEKPIKALGQYLMQYMGKEATKSVGDAFARIGAWTMGKGPSVDLGKGALPLGSSAANAMWVQLAGMPSSGVPIAGPGNITRSALAPIANDNAAQAATAGGTNWLSYLNQGATRNQPLDPKLVNAFSFLPEKGIKMEVFSGGQPGIGEGGARVGSTRHDHGNAADVFFSQNGRRLDWNNPADVPVYQDIVRQARANGVTGFGAGPGYMQPGSMHVGYGAPGVWGAGGEGANAPGWLRNAYASPGGAASPGATTAALTAQSQAMAETTASIRQMNATAKDAAPALGGVAQNAAGAGNVFGDLAQGLGGMLGMALGGKKNGAMGGMIGMLLGKVVGAGAQEGGWLSSLFKFEDGGVMTSRGRLPLRAYSAGGVASSPQLAMFGEGSVPEAYVPVPSGRIPVEMNMPRPITPPAARGRDVSYRGGDLIVQGNADDTTLPKLQRAMEENNRKMLEQIRYERANEWRQAG